MFIRVLACFTGLLCLFACGRDAVPTSDSRSVTGPSAVQAMSPAAVASGAGTAQRVGSENVIVNMLDACDPATFDAAVGEGTCVRNGGVKFDDFLAQLGRLGFVGPWHFSPNLVNARTGQEFLVVNRGGEVHTFTEVEEFGGGIVPSLNALAHLPNVAPECQALDGDEFVAPGQTYKEDIDEAGHEKYQCCIHPWMRLEVEVSEAHRGH